MTALTKSARLAFAGALVGACAPGGYRSIEGPPAAARVIFPFDTVGRCGLETSADEALSDRTSWSAAVDVTNQPLAVLERGEVGAPGAGGPAAFAVARVRDAAGRSTWVRLAGGATSDPIACAVDERRIGAIAKPIQASTVRLLPHAPSCHGLRPITGGAEDVTFEPYNVVLRRAYRVAGGVELGVTLQSASGAKLLTVPSDQFEGCFAATTRRALPGEQEQSVVDWFGHPHVDGEPAPDVPLDAALVALGIDESSCLHEGEGATRHRECRASATTLVSLEDGALLDFSRVRVPPVHGYGDKLVSPRDVAPVEVVVSLGSSGGNPALSKAFDAALVAAASDPDRQRRREEHGYRLMRAAEVTPPVTANQTLDVDLSLATSEPETSSEARRLTRATGKHSVPHPDAPRAAAKVANAQRRINQAARIQANLGATFAAGAPSCAAEGAVVCDADAARARDALALWSQAADGRLRAAQADAARLPAAVDADVTEAVDYSAKVFRRRGDAKIKLSISSHDQGKQVSLATTAPFVASTLDVQADPAHGIDAKKGAPPTSEEINAAAATAAVERIDEVLETWMSRSVVHVEPEALAPGTRAYMALLGRHIASNRRVKLFSDLVDNRPSALAQAEIAYPIRLPEGSQSRCYTFVAASADTTPGDVNLWLANQGVVVARDKRPDSTAGFEVCNAPPGTYTATVSPSSKGLKTIALSIFDSTPGQATDDDVRNASAGIPPSLTPPAQTK